MNEEQTILLVDDSESDLFLMRIAFKKAQFNNPLKEARSGDEAISYLEGEGEHADRIKYPFPFVVLLDLNMPGKSGFEVLNWIRAHSRFKALPVIILTASMRDEDAQLAFNLGANAFLIKPGAIEDLAAMIRCLHDWLGYNHFPPYNEAVNR
jgi:CheY-like chemotaxis protein